MDTATLDVIAHTVDAIRRTGARQVEVGFLDDEPPHRWWASATYDGTKAACENQDTPAEAILGLYAMLAAGGRCTTCSRAVALHDGEDGLTVRARMRHGQFETRRTSSQWPHLWCVRVLDLDGWTRCQGDGA